MISPLGRSNPDQKNREDNPRLPAIYSIRTANNRGIDWPDEWVIMDACPGYAGLDTRATHRRSQVIPRAPARQQEADCGEELKAPR